MILIKKTLSERVLSDFSRIRVKKVYVKVPKLMVKKKVKKARELKPKAEDKIPNSSIVSILIKNALEKAKREKKEKGLEEGKSYTILKENRALVVNGGYGTTSRGYGATPHTSYVDYAKLFSYLGKYRAQSGFENFVSDSPTERINKIMEQGNKFYLVDREVIDTGIRAMKYFTHGTITGDLSAVPMGGISSGDWEKFKLWKLVDYVMFKFKMDTL